MEYRHRPPHLTQSDSWYHITASTLHKQRLFKGHERKTLLREVLQRKTEKFDVTLRAWVILDDHYHLLCCFPQADVMSRFIGELHGASAHGLNKLDALTMRSVWQNYWDRCVRDEHELWVGFNYIHQNPVKHGYVERIENWDFSSYRFWLEKRGSAWMTDCLAQYPVVDFLGGE